MPGNRTSSTMQLGESDLPLFKYSSADLKSSTFRPAAPSKIRNRARRDSSLSIIAIKACSTVMSYCQPSLLKLKTCFGLVIGLCTIGALDLCERQRLPFQAGVRAVSLHH